MLWPRCSRIGSRRKGSSRIPARLVHLTLLLLLATALPAQLQHFTTLRTTDDHLSVSMTAAGADVEALFQTLRRGLRVRVEYRIRVSSARAHPFVFLGDRLLGEFRPAMEARWDPYRVAYVLLHSDGHESVYTDEAAFYTDLFSLTDYPIPWSEIRREPGLVVEARAEYTPIVFVAGLNILSLFTENRSESSPWSRHIVGSVGARR